MREGLCFPCCAVVSFANAHFLQRNVPRMANADHMVDIAEGELEELVGQDARSISETEQRVICEDSPQPHGPRM